MRFDWDDAKSTRLKRERGLSFDEAVVVFSGRHLVAPKSDEPEQFAAIGFVQGRLITLIHEYRVDEEGELIWLVTYWKSSKTEMKFYEKFCR